ncbi:hypothetical protein PIB30_093235, partial [Stylosanthes scabra]|nr:hypothetical protein [Stylosanthes scabra]
MHIMQGRAHRMTSPRPLRPRGLSLASPPHAWLHGLSSPGFQQMIDEILMPGNDGYRPDFDGTQGDGSHVHLDLNEPVSGPSQAFMALGETPPSAHVPGASWEIPFMALASVLTLPASPAPAEQPDEQAARGQARRVPRRR